MTEDIHSKWVSVVNRVSASVARDFPESDAEDISQQLWLTILSKRDTFKDPDAPGMTKALFRLAKSHCGKLRAEALHLSVQYNYATDDIKKILETVFERSKWYDGWVPEDAESIKDSADALDLQSDISWGISQLSDKDQRVMGRRYLLHEELNDADRQRLTRAVEKLTDVVNTYPRPGHPRRAMTNARAGYIIGGSYE